MNIEILKGYCAKVRGQQKWQDAELQDELFALFRLAWLENATLLARREGQNYYFLAFFLARRKRLASGGTSPSVSRLSLG